MNVKMLVPEIAEAGTVEWDTATYRPRLVAPDYPNRPLPRPRCCARCRRGEVGHNMPCGYGWACPNPGCDHARTPNRPIRHKEDR